MDSIQDILFGLYFNLLCEHLYGHLSQHFHTPIKLSASTLVRFLLIIPEVLQDKTINSFLLVFVLFCFIWFL